MSIPVVMLILGAFVGSFLNVCIHRLPRKASIVYPPSHCPNCKHRLSAIDLIPIISYILLQGKCRYCKNQISFRYPLVELLTAVLFAFNAFYFPNWLDLIFNAIFISSLIVIFFIDWEHMLIPDLVVLPSILAAMLYNAIKGNYISSLGGLLLGFVILWLVGLFGRLVFKKEAMGEGDYFLAAFLGASLGWQGIILALFLAYVCASIFVFPLLILKKVKMSQAIPFGPALVFGALLVLFFGPLIINWYRSLLF